ncbi:MAG: hypothetical protein HZC44_04000 [Geobacter sp.]|nr:hypothetical protein [Geobacter sp.]
MMQTSEEKGERQGMERDRQELDDLTRDIQRVLADNRTFLDRILDDDFEVGEEPDEAEAETEEEL